MFSTFSRAQIEFDSMKKQAESTNKEYDRLLLEHEKLQVGGTGTQEKTPTKTNTDKHTH